VPSARERMFPSMDDGIGSSGAHPGVATLRSFAWLTGLLEAEGTFLRPPPSSPRHPVIRCSMTDRDVVERVAAMFGTKVHTIEAHIPNRVFRLDQRFPRRRPDARPAPGNGRAPLEGNRRRANRVRRAGPKAQLHESRGDPRRVRVRAIGLRPRSRVRGPASHYPTDSQAPNLPRADEYPVASRGRVATSRRPERDSRGHRLARFLLAGRLARGRGQAVDYVTVAGAADDARSSGVRRGRRCWAPAANQTAVQVRPTRRGARVVSDLHSPQAGRRCRDVDARGGADHGSATKRTDHALDAAAEAKNGGAASRTRVRSRERTASTGIAGA
jgi:hypothetical protein